MCPLVSMLATGLCRHDIWIIDEKGRKQIAFIDERAAPLVKTQL